ncbi:hypothetical protein D9615_004997 [Tricholomella constricta]|uniref:F-box domain-containing protein n=1 Tax=Tricholomella constricta TaxID=117010 RepID=A0A8H5HH79_9AGAR|nr:hypothetical protein D9615_004997 [Tricholomella constricta]
MPLMTFHGTAPLSLNLTNRISPEIHDTIIDHLHSFRPALLSCSTVCKAWLPACRYHLFYDINLTLRLAEFLWSSSSAMKNIVPYIQNVAIGGAWSAEQRDSFDKVISLLLRLDGVRGLAFETWSWDFVSERSLGVLLKADGKLFHNVTTLRLQYLRFPSFSLLSAFIGGFVALEDLSFDNVTWDFAGLSMASSSVALEGRDLHSHTLQLTRLHIRSSPVKPILCWLFGDNDLKGWQETSNLTLRYLAIPEVSPDELHAIGSALHVLGSSLRHLEIGFLMDSNDNNVMRSLAHMIDLSHNENLHTIHIHNLTLYCFPPRTPSSPEHGYHFNQSSPLRWLVPFLDNISSHQLDEIGFHIWLSEEYHLDFVDWLALSTTLEKPVFLRLKTVRFEVSGLGEGRGDLRSWLLARLSAWKASSRAILVSFLHM